MGGESDAAAKKAEGENGLISVAPPAFWPAPFHLKVGVARRPPARPRYRDVDRSALLLGVILLLPALARADWSQRLGGRIPSQRYSPSALGIAGGIESGWLDPRGRLFVLSEQLTVFDGAKWNSYSLPDGTVVRSIAVDESGRVWAGAVNQLGYFEPVAGGRFEFHSLRDRLPDEDRLFHDVWGCARVGSSVYFVCREKVFRWDGAHFQTWRYPTARRLYPVTVGSELWFTHLESGLYRFGPNGPVKVVEPDRLPPKAAFWVEGERDNLWFGTSAGIFRLGQKDPVSGPALTEFLTQNLLFHALRLPSGELALATFGGIAIASPDLRELRRVLTRTDGLPGNEIRRLFLDEAEHLWALTHLNGMVRIDAHNSTAQFSPEGDHDAPFPIRSLAFEGHRLFSVTEGGIFSMQIDGPSGKLEPVPGGSGRYYSVVSAADELLAGTFGGVRAIAGQQARTVAERPGSNFFAFSKLPGSSQVAALEAYRVSVLTPQADRSYRYEPVQELPQPADSLLVDARGNLWINSPQNRVYVIDRESRLVEITLPEKVGSEARGTRIAVEGQRAFLLCGNAVFATAAGASLSTLPSLPDGATAVCAAAARNGAKLWAVTERIAPNGETVAGLCSLDLRSPGAGWKEWTVPSLSRLGAVRALGEDEITGHLWAGGDEGLLRIVPDSLHSAPLPRPLRLNVAGPTARGELPYRDHRLHVVAESPDLGLRPELSFQTRFTTKDLVTPWSAPLSTNAFEFRNLADGQHLLEVRAVDRQGRPTEVASYRFRVLPPVWRSPPAIGAYAVLLLAGFIGVVRFRERTIRKRNEELERTVAQRTSELRKANAAKDEFLASISHEIRNPLNGVVGLAASINPAALEPQTRLKFDYLKHCAIHLSSLLEDILDFSQLERGTLTLDPRAFDVRSLLDSIAAIAADLSAKTQRRVDIQVSPNVPAVLVGDAARLRQLLLNLVINAFKYGERGDVQLTVFARAQAGADCLVTFAVSDDGPGIPAEELNQLFQQFTRGSAAKRRRESGSGIGLSIGRAIATKMGGRLWAESELGHGSTFSFEVSLPVGGVVPTRIDSGVAPDWKILIVEDEDYNRVALSSLLESLGLKLTLASNGAEALAEHGRARFDVAFVDYDMPGLTGPEVAREIRHRGDARLLIVGTTAFVTADKHEECRLAGMNAVITKPITVDKIRAALAQIHGSQQSAPRIQLAVEEPVAPRAALEKLAQRKGKPLEAELAHFLAALTEISAALTAALQQRQRSAGAHEAHKLIGQMAYIGARRSETLGRRLEAAIGTEQWSDADRLGAELLEELDRLRRELRD